ncbi:MAG: hypothetical protein KAT71_05550, partial [Gammaproteobacteria bacterium]|nr:hypothetical protein [Gammaproteobacteria bacterium]
LEIPEAQGKLVAIRAKVASITAILDDSKELAVAEIGPAAQPAKAEVVDEGESFAIQTTKDYLIEFIQGNTKNATPEIQAILKRGGIYALLTNPTFAKSLNLSKNDIVEVVNALCKQLDTTVKGIGEIENPKEKISARTKALSLYHALKLLTNRQTKYYRSIKGSITTAAELVDFVKQDPSGSFTKELLKDSALLKKLNHGLTSADLNKIIEQLDEHHEGKDTTQNKFTVFNLGRALQRVAVVSSSLLPKRSSYSRLLPTLGFSPSNINKIYNSPNEAEKFVAGIYDKIFRNLELLAGDSCNKKEMQGAKVDPTTGRVNLTAHWKGVTKKNQESLSLMKAKLDAMLLAMPKEPTGKESPVKTTLQNTQKWLNAVLCKGEDFSDKFNKIKITWLTLAPARDNAFWESKLAQLEKIFGPILTPESKTQYNKGSSMSAYFAALYIASNMKGIENAIKDLPTQTVDSSAIVENISKELKHHKKLESKFLVILEEAGKRPDKEPISVQGAGDIDKKPETLYEQKSVQLINSIKALGQPQVKVIEGGTMLVISTVKTGTAEVRPPEQHLVPTF